MSIETIRKANPELIIRDTADPALALYGKLLDPEPFTTMVVLADRVTEIDPAVNRYVASLGELEADPAASQIALRFGFSPIQIGYCNGPNSKLNALEFILLLGRRGDIGADGTLDSAGLDCFYIEKGTVLELMSGVLHFSPCRVVENGFKSIIALPRGTNAALSPEEKTAAGIAAATGDLGASFLFMRNKWLIAHPDRKVLVERGAFPGIRGENIEILLP
jgi:hypothetical protein